MKDEKRKEMMAVAREKAYQSSRSKQRDDTESGLIRRVSFQEGFDAGWNARGESRFADYLTNGVAAIQTRGEKDTWPEATK